MLAVVVVLEIPVLLVVQVVVVLVEQQLHLLQQMVHQILVVAAAVHMVLHPQQEPLAVRVLSSFLFLQHNQLLTDISTQHQGNGQHHQELHPSIML
jgi:hypothetical protein